jgi:hypothetical protein
MLLMEITRARSSGAPSLTAATLSSTARIRVFLGRPMSYFGFIYYLFMFGLAARLAYEPFSSSLRFRAILYAALSAISSVYFLYLQLG